MLRQGITGAAVDATAADAIETSREEQEEPRCKGDPHGIADLGEAALHRIDARLGNEEECKIKDECSQGYSRTKSRDACAQTGHGKFTYMGKETEERRAGGKAEGDDMK